MNKEGDLMEGVGMGEEGNTKAHDVYAQTNKTQ